MTVFSSISSTTGSLLAANASAFSITEIAGQEYVEFPGSSFVMGSSAFDNAPPHWVELSPFAIGRTAVSADHYRSRTQRVDDRIKRLQADYPVTHVSWLAAVDYLAQLSSETERPIGLPTEAQWEFAARGPAVELRALMEAEQGAFRPDDLREFVAGRFENFYTEIGGRIYTDPTDEAFQSLLRQVTPLYGYRVYGTPSGRLTPDEAYYDQEGPASVNWGPDNAYGLKGMTGGVWEWVYDWYDELTYHRSNRKDPQGPQAGPYFGNLSGVHKGLRGGSWGDADPDYLRVASRSYGRHHDFADDDVVGFRGVVASRQ